jgi:tetratricopeptide (TPR) repeat protein
MLAPLPKGSVVFGGSDPGRFIPTYLIFGESSLPPNRRIDPAFDRRDLYILTQNALADRFYLAYVRDHYTADRPPARNWFERWLGRDQAYPREPLVLPTLEEIQDIQQEAATKLKESGKAISAAEAIQAVQSSIAKWVFEKNKARHAFYVEESFPMTWSYDSAIPEGLLFRINPEPLPTLSDDIVRKDFAFWTDYIARLKANPAFAKDYDAQRSFSHLRITGGNIYQHRGMLGPAEAAYRQALDLRPDSAEAVAGLTKILWKRRAFDEAIELCERARQNDPLNANLLMLRLNADSRKQKQAEIDRLLPIWRAKPEQLEPLGRLVELYSQIGEETALDDLLKEAIGKIGNRPQFLSFLSQVCEAREDWASAADAADHWMRAAPQSPEAAYRLARAQFILEKKPEAVKALVTAIKLGGIDYRERLFKDPVFESLKDIPELNRLMVAPPPKAQ